LVLDDLPSFVGMVDIGVRVDGSSFITLAVEVIKCEVLVSPRRVGDDTPATSVSSIDEVETLSFFTDAGVCSCNLVLSVGSNASPSFVVFDVKGFDCFKFF